MNAHNPDEQTRIDGNVFEHLTDAELTTMLETAGIRPCKSRSLKLQQAELMVEQKINDGAYMKFL